MPKYKKILLAVDFEDDNDKVIEKALQVTRDNEATLLLVHVNEPMLGAYPVGPTAAWSIQYGAFETDLREFFKKKLHVVAAGLEVPTENCFLPAGNAATEIRQLAADKKVDLIVIGTHGRHGLGLLLGSTANGVLHGVTCDVLAVRTKS